MWKFVPAIAVVALAANAAAADMPVLRGSIYQPQVSRAVNWDGYYIGGHAGRSASSGNFTGSTTALVERLLHNTLINSEMGVSGWAVMSDRYGINDISYGAFGGYTAQWDDVIYGLEVTYNHGRFGGGNSGTTARRSTLSDGATHNVSLSASGSAEIRDYATFRARAGYAFDSFLGYMFGGVAVGSADIVRSARITDRVEPPAPAVPYNVIPLTDTIVDNGRFVYGYTAGLGIDMRLYSNLFLRGEYEFTRFTSTGEITINTVRGGLGYKF